MSYRIGGLSLNCWHITCRCAVTGFTEKPFLTVPPGFFLLRFSNIPLSDR